MTKNPFIVTKASDFTDEEINSYWVNFEERGFENLVRPRELFPMHVLGGKGTGKTHLMRYFSYELQKLRTPRCATEDGYLGIYVRCKSLNSSRFREKGIAQAEWDGIFAYYMDIWLAQRTIQVILDLCESCVGVSLDERLLARLLTDFFDKWEFPTPETLTDMLRQLTSLQKEIDLAVNNIVFRRGSPLDVEVLCSPGRLVFGLPRLLKMHCPDLADVNFLYLVDELENLTLDQQVYINTLVREREGNCSFRIGARLYGIRTQSTLAASEENKEGSEFETLRLDEKLRSEPEKFNRFARELCERRISEAGYSLCNDTILENLFQSRNRTSVLEEIKEYLEERHQGDERPYFSKLRYKLEQYQHGFSSDDITEIINALRSPSEPLLEKLNVFSFYQAWASRSDLLMAAKRIRKDCEAYLKGQRTSKYSDRFGHFADDLFAQLCRECRTRYRYYGLDVMLQISLGTPRNLLKILKSVFSWTSFYGEDPFSGQSIPEEYQDRGIRESAEWFYLDALGEGEYAAVARTGVGRLAELFREVRYADKPPECCVTTFSTNWDQLASESKECLEACCNASLLFEIRSGHKDKNSLRVDKKYQLNPVLSAKWDLGIARRGTLSMPPEEVDSLFVSSDSVFKEFLNARKGRMNAPFRARPGGAQMMLEF